MKMSDQLYKVIEDQMNKTVYAGTSDGKSKPKGVELNVAEKVRDERNANATSMGLKTLYRVVEF
jgi:hypothetical protein